MVHTYSFYFPVMNVDDFIVTTVPNTVIYLPDFISLEEEKEILDKVYSAPKPKWTQLRNRRLQNWGGVPHVNGIRMFLSNFRFGPAGSHRTFFCLGRRRCARPSVSMASNNISLQTNKDVDDERPSGDSAKLRMSWLMLNRSRRPTPVQLLTTSVKSTPATNHYTVEETYTSINEVVYTELDRIPSPAYQNSGYILEMDNDPVSSAPSSAYYSDISAHGAYEMVGQTAIWNSGNIGALSRLGPPHLRHSTSIPEDTSVHSNYI